MVLIFLALSVPGGFFLLKCPPLWRDYDGLIQISNRPNDMTLLQYPPAYPAFSRLHVYAAQMLGFGRAGKKQAINLQKSVELNDAGIRALLVSQQLALALACTCFVRVGARGWKASLMVGAILLSNATIFLAAQLISTEALSQSLLVLFIALGLRLFLSAKIRPAQYISYGLVLFLLVLTRHANAVFAGITPLAFLASGLLGRITSGTWLAAPWRRAALLTGVGILAIRGAAHAGFPILDGKNLAEQTCRPIRT